jgi:hypothetical protein
MSGGGRVEQPQHATEGSRRNRNDAEVDRRHRQGNVDIVWLDELYRDAEARRLVRGRAVS